MKKLHQNLDKKGNTVITRPPVVVLLGHVDHGKTTLLDAISQTKFAISEFGEITQQIRACQVETKFGKITFIDTPGHSYFSNLRGKGVEFADIGLLVVSAVEGVREQTAESIELIKKAKIPLICVISKTDLPKANSLKVKKQLVEAGVLLEGEGGQIPVVEVSSLAKTGVDELIETISILASLEDFKADLNSKATGVVLESFLDKKAGCLSLVLTKNGILKTGSYLKADSLFGKIKAIFDEHDKSIKKAFPSQPVKILGFNEIVKTGSEFCEVTEFLEAPKEFDKKAATISPSLRELAKKRLGVILKADSIGAKEAVLANVPKNVTIVDSGVGQITSSDVEKAAATDVKIFGFNVGTTPDAAKLLESHKGLFFSSKLIYELIDEIKKEADKFYETKEEVLGTAKILKSFDIAGVKVAGCKVMEGYLATGGNVKIFRGDKEVARTKIASIRQFTTSIDKITAVSECGVGFTTHIDFQVGDVLKFVS